MPFSRPTEVSRLKAQKIRTLITGVLLAGSIMAFGAPLHASQGVANRLMLAAQQQISLDQAIARVRKQTGGRILSANTSKKGGHKTHRIKVLMPNGVVRVIHVDAASGR